MGFAASNEMVGLGESDTDNTDSSENNTEDKTPAAEKAPEKPEPEAATD